MQRWIVVLLCLLASSRASAAPTEPSRAESLFTSGKEAMARGDFANACARLAESLKLEFAIGTLLNLATCEERSGKVASAVEHFKVALSRLPTDDFRVTFTTERIARLSPRVARLAFHFATPPPPGTRITCDGVEVASLDVPMPVDPGTHPIVVERPGRPSWHLAVSVQEGQEKKVELEVANAPSDARASSSDPPPTGNTSRALSFGALGLGIAGIATGTITGIMAINAANTYKEHCVNGECDEDGLAAASTGRTVSIVSPVAFAIGAAFLTLGAILFFTSAKEEKPASR